MILSPKKPMFNWFKQLRRSAAFVTRAQRAQLHWNFCFIRAAHGSTARHYDIVFWREVADAFRAKWREIEPVSKDPGQLFEQRLIEYLSFLENIVLKKAGPNHLTVTHMEEVGVFIARASVLDLRDALLSDPAGASSFFHLLPRAWLETADITPEYFDHYYFQFTGKRRDFQLLENQVGKEISDKFIAHMSKLSQQEQDKFIRDFKEHISKSMEKRQN